MLRYRIDEYFPSLVCREVLEGMMDDEDELKDFNLSSRVVREERRRQRERNRLQRELERERNRRDSQSSSATVDLDMNGGREPLADYRRGQGQVGIPPTSGDGSADNSSGIDGSLTGDGAQDNSNREGAAFSGSGYGNWEKSLRYKESSDGSYSDQNANPTFLEGDDSGVANKKEAKSVRFNGSERSEDLTSEEAIHLKDTGYERMTSGYEWMNSSTDNGKTRGRNREWREGQSSRCIATPTCISVCTCHRASELK
jgi:hypothetical protein